jgi:hypothetical protein
MGPMKDINENELKQVAKHYKEGKMDLNSKWKVLEAYIKSKRKDSTRIFRKPFCIAASLLLIAVIAMAFVAVRSFKFNHHDNDEKTDDLIYNDSIPKHEEDSTKVFTFDNEAIEDVLYDLSQYYGKEFTTNDSGKFISGKIQADNPDSLISIIEQTLNIKIECK